MATNIRFTNPGTLVLPVGDGVVSGDLVVVGGIVGVALTDENDGGNVDNSATVLVAPAPVAEFPVVGADGAGNAAIAVGDPVYQDGAQINADVTNGTLIGHALAAVSSGATTTIAVRLVAYTA